MSKTLRLILITTVSYFFNPLLFAQVKLQFISDYNFLTGTKINTILIGGFSGCTYSNKNKVLYALSDDRGQFGNPRIHSFFLSLEKKRFKLSPSKVIQLRDKTRNSFPLDSLDLEGMILKGKSNFLLISEGIYKPKRISPEIFQFSFDGILQKKFSLPKHFSEGFQSNKSFESLTLSKNEDFLLTTTELPLKQDSLNKDDPYTLRILKMKKLNSNTPITKEYVYLMKKLKDYQNLKSSKGSTGLVELLLLDDSSFLALERSYLTEEKKNMINIFHVKMSKEATEVSNHKSLSKSSWMPLNKNLILNLDEIVPKLSKNFQKLDNFEGMCFGPKLKNGNQTLILVSDNNFNKFQRTAFLLFEIIR